MYIVAEIWSYGERVAKLFDTYEEAKGYLNSMNKKILDCFSGFIWTIIGEENYIKIEFKCDYVELILIEVK